MAKIRVLITGDTGLLGANLAYLWRDEYDVTGVSRGTVHIAGTRHIALDLTDPSTTGALFYDIRPDVIIHTAALADVDACERDPDLARVMNTEMTSNITRAATRIHAHLIHISTDAFYQSQDGKPCDEAHPLTLNNVYCRTKYAAEASVMSYARGLVLRTNFYGFNLLDKISFSEWIHSGITSGKTLNMFSDVFFSPILVNDLADILRASINKSLFGLYNAGGTGCLSKYEFAVLLKDIFRINTGELVPSSIRSARLCAWRSNNMSTDNAKIIKALSIIIPDVTEGIRNLKAFMEAAYPSKLKEASV